MRRDFVIMTFLLAMDSTIHLTVVSSRNGG